MFGLRPYQNQAEVAIFADFFERNLRSTLIVLPTGTGKTVTFASVARDFVKRTGKKVLVVAHRQELIWQARDKIQKVTGLNVDVEMGEYKATQSTSLFHPRADVIVVMIQTLFAGGDGGGRMSKFDPADFGLMIVDEAHHATAVSYRKVMDYFQSNPELKLLGVTATPDRADEEALGQVFESVAFDYEILDAIKDGWLVPIDQQMVSVEGLDYSDVRTTAGDLNGADLAKVMESEKNLQGIAGSTIDIIGDRRGIGFASSVEHARILTEIFNRYRSGFAMVVSAKTPDEERKKIIADFSAGKTQWLWNCGIFTEGFDDSGVEVIAMARPTKSRSLYAQMAGRGTRPHETIAHTLNNSPVPALRRGMIARSRKPGCLIIDFVGNSGKHKLMTTADILGGNVSDEAIEEAIKFAKKSGKPVRMAAALEEEEKKQQEIKQRRAEEEARKAKLVAKTNYKLQRVDPFDILQIKPIANVRGWDKGKSFSQPQLKILRDQGVDPDARPYHETKQILNEIFHRWDLKKTMGDKAPPSFGQLKWLKPRGYTVATTGEASRIMDAWKQNNWRRPESIEPANVPVMAGDDGDSDNIPF